jgi:hypothetical protein
MTIVQVATQPVALSMQLQSRLPVMQLPAPQDKSSNISNTI